MKDWSREIAFVDWCTEALKYILAAAVVGALLIGTYCVWVLGWR